MPNTIGVLACNWPASPPDNVSDQVDTLRQRSGDTKGNHCSERRVPGETPGTTPGDGYAPQKLGFEANSAFGCDSLKPSALRFNAQGGLNLREFFA